MSGNTSASGGYLTPNAEYPVPLDDNALNDVLHALFTGITGLVGDLVRPRWQRPIGTPPMPPQQPPPETNWCAIGVTNQTPYGNPAMIHNPDKNNGDGSSTQFRFSEFSVLASFYGPNAQSLANMTQSGLYLDQNMWPLYDYDIKLKSVDDIVVVPELINMQWINRCDVTVHFARSVVNSYDILNILSAPTVINKD